MKRRVIEIFKKLFLIVAIPAFPTPSPIFFYRPTMPYEKYEKPGDKSVEIIASPYDRDKEMKSK